MPFDYKFCFNSSKECIKKTFRCAKMLTCLILYSRKIFLIPLPLLSSRLGYSIPHILSKAKHFLMA